MPLHPALVAAAHRNFIASCRLTARYIPEGEVRERGGVVAFTSRLPVPLFNGCVVVDRAPEAILVEAIDWLDRLELPYSIWIDADAAPDAVACVDGLGLPRQPADYPGMVLHPLPERIATPSDVVVEEVSAATLEDHTRLRIEFGWPEAIVRRMFSPELNDDPDVSLFTARWNGEPVGCAMSVRFDDTIGVYAVGTLKRARRRGVGTAATWAAIDAGRRRGCTVAVLQASEMGLPLYRGMGFRTVAPYATYLVRPSARS